MIALADRLKFESLGLREPLCIWHVQEGHLVPSRNQFASQRSERMNVTGNRWANDSETHFLRCGLSLNFLPPTCALPSTCKRYWIRVS